jgi:hypothetical protein
VRQCRSFACAFDTVCQAEPALDLGQFLAYLRLAVRKASGNGTVPPLEAALAWIDSVGRAKVGQNH